MNTTTNKKTNMALVIIFVSCLLFIILLIYPLFKGIKEESENIIFQRNLLAGLESSAENLQVFQATYQTYQANLEKINQLFISSTEPVSFIEFLEEEAEKSQLSIDISPLVSKEVKGERWPSINFQLTLRGDFADFLQFFEKIETSSYLVEILNLSARTLTREFPGDVDVSLLIKVYAKEQ